MSLRTLKAIAALGMIEATNSGEIGMFTEARLSKKQWKPEFTEEELTELRSLPKRERNKRVKELRAKYIKGAAV